MTQKNPHPNEVTRRRIETFFPSRDPEKLVNAALECKGGYILQEVRPYFKDPSIKTESPMQSSSIRCPPIPGRSIGAGPMGIGTNWPR